MRCCTGTFDFTCSYVLATLLAGLGTPGNISAAATYGWTPFGPSCRLGYIGCGTPDFTPARFKKTNTREETNRLTRVIGVLAGSAVATRPSPHDKRTYPASFTPKCAGPRLLVRGYPSGATRAAREAVSSKERQARDSRSQTYAETSGMRHRFPGCTLIPLWCPEISHQLRPTAKKGPLRLAEDLRPKNSHSRAQKCQSGRTGKVHAHPHWSRQSVLITLPSFGKQRRLKAASRFCRARGGERVQRSRRPEKRRLVHCWIPVNTGGTEQGRDVLKRG